MHRSSGTLGVLALLLLSGCGNGGSAPSNAVPSLVITEPSSDITVSRGGYVEVEYTDDDPDDAALTWLVADRDGDPETVDTGDRTLRPNPDMDGTSQTVRLTLAEAGRFAILGEIHDGINAPATARAPGHVDVRNVAWARGIGDSTPLTPRGVATLNDGSCVVAGSFTDMTTFGSGEANEISLTGDHAEVFVARYDPDGTLAWAKRAGGLNNDRAYAIAAYTDGSFVVTGHFGGAATFGPGEVNETTLTGIGTEVFVARYNPDGSLAWAKRAGGAADDIGKGIAALPDGSCLVTGYFRLTATFGAGEANETSLTGDSADLFVARYNPDGTLAWAKRAGGMFADREARIASLPDGASLLTGHFAGTMVFGPGEVNETRLTAAGTGADLFVARYNPDGTLVWVKQAGGPTNEQSGDIAALEDGSCVVTGSFRDTAVFGPGEPNETRLTAVQSDAFVARYNPDGTLAWAGRAGGSAGNDWGSAIAAYADGSCVVTGVFRDAAVFGPGQAGETSLIADFRDLFVARYAADGTLLWARGSGGPGEDYARAVAIHADGSFAVTANTYGGSASFGGAVSISTEAALARYNADGGF